jgi:assimilatory nitrate reductase catalytic subunit
MPGRAGSDATKGWIMDTAPRFLNGIYAFTGAGLDKPMSLDSKLTYMVPGDKRSQLIYLRGGNSSTDLITLVLMRDGKPMRYFPIGAKSSVHVPLAVVEDLFPETKLDVYLAAPEGVTGFAVIDIGLMEV